MKKLILILTVFITANQLRAQNINPEGDNIMRAPKPAKVKKQFTRDSSLSRWVLDVNLTGGIVTQQFTGNNIAANYNNSVNDNISSLKFQNGSSFGADAEVGYFFGHKRHWGVGTGVLYMYQQGTAAVDNFHVEYQSTDFQGNTYRQLVTANGGLKESVNISNLNIPVLLKYKARLSDKIGISVDAGALINLQEKNYYNNNANFNYEAIYDYVKGDGGTVTSVYDNSPIPGSSDLLITQAQYQSNHTAAQTQAYFNALRSEGYNVGLGVNPSNNSGNLSYTSGSIGLIVRPAVDLFLSDKVALNLGVFYVYQDFNKNTSAGYVPTDKVGSYNSVLNTVSSSMNNVYGLNLGVRFFFGKLKDSDGDGVPDKYDRCPLDPGPKELQGCPDRDNDGIPDIDDACPDVPGVAEFNGCPDTDGDGIPDNEDACPYTPGLEKFDGCPDTDNDGIPDREDACPLQPGPEKYHGCPDTDGDGVPDNLDQCPTVPGPASNNGCPLPEKQKEQEAGKEEDRISISTPILFEDNSTVIRKRSYPVLEEAVKELKKNKRVSVTINGYASLEGSKQHNLDLSRHRAMKVKEYLRRKGVNTSLIEIVAHGSNDPVASNKTEAGRERNRRAVIRLNHHKGKKAAKTRETKKTRSEATKGSGDKDKQVAGL